MNLFQFFTQWRSWIRPLVIGLYLIAILIALPLVIVEFQVHGTDKHLQAWFIGGFFVLLGVPISFWGILQHLIHFTNPLLQKNIIRILWMVPIYAGDAWFALRFKNMAIYLDTMRECYEAYVIYNFMVYLLNFLRAEYPQLETHLSTKPQVKHLIPFCCLPSWPMGSDLIENCKHGVLQYTVVRPLTTCIALITQLAGVYDEGDLSFKSAWAYIIVINNVSQVWAMYCLVLFYKATKEELRPLKPIGKFMCIKAVVFFTFWQQIVIAALVQFKLIKPTLDFSTDDIATGLQDFIICIEMFFAAVAHYFSFSHKPYADPDGGQVDCLTSFVHMWDVSDVRDDVYNHVRTVGKRVTRPLRPKAWSRAQEDERSPLLDASQDSEDDGGTYSRSYPSAGSGAAVHQSGGAGLDRSRSRGLGSVSTIGSFEDSTDPMHGRDRRFTASMHNYFDENSEPGGRTSGDRTPGERTPRRSISRASHDSHVTQEGRDSRASKEGGLKLEHDAPRQSAVAAEVGALIPDLAPPDPSTEGHRGAGPTAGLIPGPAPMPTSSPGQILTPTTPDIHPPTAPQARGPDLQPPMTPEVRQLGAGDDRHTDTNSPKAKHKTDSPDPTLAEEDMDEEIDTSHKQDPVC